ncbi:MAG: glycosyltransferase [candidate division WOR-3 bacterium]
MKIAIILPTLQGGGAEKSLINLGEFIVKNYPEFHIDFILYKDVRDYDTILNVIPILDRNEKVSKNLLKFFNRLYKILKNYDIIVGGLELEPSYLSIIFSKILGKKSISLHHSLENRLIGNKFLYHFLNFILLRFANLNICVSNEVRETIIKLYKITSKKCICIYNPLDIEKIRNLSNEPIEENYKFIFNKKTLCFIARLEEYKGLKKVISALKNLENYHLLVMGKGNFEIYYEYAKKLNVENRVFYIGFKKNPYKYIKNSFALVLPSEFEGFGMVFYEAMALGIPIVGSGIKETFGNNNEYGIYANSVDEIVNAIRMLENDEIYNYYKQSGLKRVENFRIDKIAKEYIDVFKAC